MKVKLSWVPAAPKPTGLARIGAKRGWSTAYFPSGNVAAKLYCDDEYNGHSIKGTNARIKIHLAEYHRDPEKIKQFGAFTWVELVTSRWIHNLKDAKAAVVEAYTREPYSNYPPEGWSQEKQS